MDLISRDLAITELTEKYKYSNGYAHEMARECLDAIIDLPIINSAHWINTHSIEDLFCEVLQCSNCGYEDFDMNKFCYCPSCGKYMTDEDSIEDCKHGCWIESRIKSHYVCSECDSNGGDGWSVKPSYCPDCGVRMDLHSCYECKHECLDGCCLKIDSNGIREPVSSNLIYCINFEEMTNLDNCDLEDDNS